MAYDALILLALWMVAGFAVVPLLGGAPRTPEARLLYQIYLALVAAAYFIGFWIYGGQTVGARAWRLRVVPGDGGRLNPAQALIRFAVSLVSGACLGLGYLWVLVDRQGLAWHDRASRTRVVLLPKPDRR